MSISQEFPKARARQNARHQRTQQTNTTDTIVNLSNKRLTTAEKEVLNKGLSFVPNLKTQNLHKPEHWSHHNPYPEHQPHTYILHKENTQNPMSDRPIISTATHHHRHKTIQRQVNKHWTRFQSKQIGNPELSRNITMCYRWNPSLRNKLAKTRNIEELATPTNRPTLKPQCTNKCWNRKCPTCPNIPTRHQYLSITLGTTHTTKCNYTCRSSGMSI